MKFFYGYDDLTKKSIKFRFQKLVLPPVASFKKNKNTLLSNDVLKISFNIGSLLLISMP